MECRRLLVSATDQQEMGNFPRPGGRPSRAKPSHFLPRSRRRSGGGPRDERALSHPLGVIETQPAAPVARGPPVVMSIREGGRLSEGALHEGMSVRGVHEGFPATLRGHK